MGWKFAVIFILAFGQKSAVSANFLIGADTSKDVAIISHVLQDVVDKYLVEEKIEFNIVIFKEIKDFSTKILENFLTQSDAKFRKQIEHHKIQDQTYFLYRATVLFLNSIEDFYAMHLDYNILRYQNQPFKFIVFIPNLSYDELKIHRLLRIFSSMTMFDGEIIHHTYFIINEETKIVLATVEYFSPKYCNQAHLVKLNEFDKKSLKWTSTLKNYEKFLNFHGCELVLLLPVAYVNAVNLYMSGYAIVNENRTEFTAHGITPVLFNITAKAHNFVDGYQPVVIRSIFLYLLEESEVFIVRINNTFKRPDVFLFTLSIQSFESRYRVSNVFMDLPVLLYVTPAEAYTPYEKLFLPFDLQTWIFLAVTFSVAFLIIFIANQLPKSFRNLLYGHNVSNPTWNVVRIFFGISQTQLPVKNFPRFLLALFLMFCLIFRTCYQNKLFEFMTSEPRRSPPKMRSDLIDRNYRVHSMIINPILMSSTDEGERNLNVKHILNHYDFYREFETQSQNASAKLCLCVDELFQNELELRRSKNYEWIQLNEPLYVSHEAFGLVQNSFAFRMFKKTADKLIDTGIMDYLGREHYTRKRTYLKIQSGPKVLSLDDLSFGFNIWLGFCCLSTFVFLMEKALKRRKNKEKPQRFKFAKIHPLTTVTEERCAELKAATCEKFKVRSTRSKGQENLEITAVDDANPEINLNKIDTLQIPVQVDLTALELF